MDEKKIKKAGMVAVAVPVLTVGTVALVSAYQSDNNFQPFATERELQKNQVVFSDSEDAVGQQEEKQGDESEYWKKDHTSNQEKSPTAGSQEGKYLFENGILEQNNQAQSTAGILGDNMASAMQNTTGQTTDATGQPLYHLTGDRSQADTILRGNGETLISGTSGNNGNSGSSDKEGSDKKNPAGDNKKNDEKDHTNSGGNNQGGNTSGDDEEPVKPSKNYAASVKEPEISKKPQNPFPNSNIKNDKYSENPVKEAAKNPENKVVVRIGKSLNNTENALYKGQTISQKRIFNALDTYVYVSQENETAIYHWLEDSLNKYIRIDAVSFDGGQSWITDFPVTIPKNIEDGQMKLKVHYRLYETNTEWEESIVDYEPEDSRVCVLSEALTMENQVLDASKIINTERQYQQDGALLNLFYFQLNYLKDDQRLTSLFPGWCENGKRVDWFYPVTIGRHILEPEDMVPLDTAYEVRLRYVWMNRNYQVDAGGSELCYLQTLVNVEQGAVETGRQKQTTLEVPEYIQAVRMDEEAQVAVDNIKIPNTVLYVDTDSTGMKVKKSYQVADKNPYYDTSEKGYLTNKAGTEYLGIPYEVTDLSPETMITKIHISKENQIHTIRMEASEADTFPEINYENLTNCKILVPEKQIEAFTKAYWNDIKKGSEVCVASMEHPSRTYTVKYGCMIDQNGTMRRMLLPAGSRILLPEEVKKVEADAFSGVDTITSLLLSENSENIILEENCFRNSGIRQIICHTQKQYENITEQLKKIGMAEQIEVVFVDGVSREGYKYTIRENDGKQQVVLLSVPKDLKSFDGTMTDKKGNSLDVEVIDDYAFGESQTLEWVRLPETVKTLGFGTFRNCTALQEVMIESQDTIEIGDQAFDGCSSLRFVGSNAVNATMDNNYTPAITDSQGNSVFYTPTNSEGYRGNISFTPESGVVSYQMLDIGETGKALYGMDAAGAPWILLRTGAVLDSQTTLPVTTIEIWSQALENTTAESGSFQINWNDFGQLFVDSGAFENSQLGGDLVFGNNCYLADYALHNCSQITSVTVGNNIGNLGAKVFAGCSNLKRAEFGTLRSGVSFENGLFDGCNQLTTITINSYWAPALLCYDFGKYQFNYSWTEEEEASRLHLQVPEGAEENYIQKWRYLYAGSVDTGDYPAYLNLWYQLRIDHMDWESWEFPSDEEVDAWVEAEVLEAENRIRSMMGIGQVQEPTQYYPYHLDNEGKLTLVGASSDTEYMDLWMGMDNLPTGKLVNYIGTGAFAKAKNLGGVMFPESISGIYTNAFQGVESGSLLLSFMSDTPPELLGWSKEEPFTFGVPEDNIEVQLWGAEWENYVRSWIFPMAGYTDLTEMRKEVKEELTAAGVDASDEAVDTEIANRLLPLENKLRKMFGQGQITNAEDMCVKLDHLPDTTTEPEETREADPEITEEAGEQQKQEAAVSSEEDTKEEETEDTEEHPKSDQSKEDSDPSRTENEQKDQEKKEPEQADQTNQDAAGGKDPATEDNIQEKETQKDTDTATQTGSGEETQK